MSLAVHRIDVIESCGVGEYCSSVGFHHLFRRETSWISCAGRHQSYFQPRSTKSSISTTNLDMRYSSGLELLKNEQNAYIEAILSRETGRGSILIRGWLTQTLTLDAIQ